MNSVFSPDILIQETDRRGLILRETIDTEQNFILDMETFISEYRDPVLASGVLPKNESDVFFHEIEELLLPHKMFCEKMLEEKRNKGNEMKIGKIYLDFVRKMEKGDTKGGGF